MGIDNEKKIFAFMEQCASCPSSQVKKENVKLSSYNSNSGYEPGKCVDYNPSTFCHNEGPEQNPFLVLEYDSPVSVPEVVVTNRADCCGQRTKNMFVTVTNMMPVKGNIAQGDTLGSFTGPGSKGQVIPIKATGEPPVGKYVVIQMRTNANEDAMLNLAEVEVVCSGSEVVDGQWGQWGDW